MQHGARRRDVIITLPHMTGCSWSGRREVARYLLPSCVSPRALSGGRSRAGAGAGAATLGCVSPARPPSGPHVTVLEHRGRPPGTDGHLSSGAPLLPPGGKPTNYVRLSMWHGRNDSRAASFNERHDRHRRLGGLQPICL